jgi:hypothetical protein
MTDSWAKVVISVLLTMILGSYTFTYVTRTEIMSSLYRIENKMDCFLGLPTCQ